MAHSCSSLGSLDSKTESCHSTKHTKSSEVQVHHQKKNRQGPKFQSHKQSCPFCALKACEQKFVPSQATALVEVLKVELFSNFETQFVNQKLVTIEAQNTGPPPERYVTRVPNWQSFYLSLIHI